MSLQVPDSCYSVSFYSLVLSCNNDRHLQPLLKLWGEHWGLCSREKILTHLLVSSMLITLWQTITQYTIRWDNSSLCIDTLYFSFLCTYLIWKHCCSRSTIKKQNKTPTCSWALCILHENHEILFMFCCSVHLLPAGDSTGIRGPAWGYHPGEPQTTSSWHFLEQEDVCQGEEEDAQRIWKASPRGLPAALF